MMRGGKSMKNATAIEVLEYKIKSLKEQDEFINKEINDLDERKVKLQGRKEEVKTNIAEINLAIDILKR